MRAVLNFLRAIALTGVAAIPASAATLTITNTGPNTGAVGVQWSTGNFVCNPPGGGICTIPNLAPGTELRVSANSPGSYPGVITTTTGDAGTCNPTSTCRFTINSDSSMTVFFGPGDHRSLQIHLNGTGNVGADNNQCQNFELAFSACTTTYAAGSEVTLQGRVMPGHNFVSFSGGTNEAGGCSVSPCVFTLNANSEVTANFADLTSIAVQPVSADVSVGGGQNFSATGTFSSGAPRPIMFGQGLWQPRAPLGSARFSLAAAALDNRIYAFGGTAGVCSGSPCAFGPLNTVEMFDPVTNFWTANFAAGTPFAPIPTAREGAAAAVLGGEIFVVGGHTSGGGAVNDVASFNPASNTWTTRPSLPTARAQLAVAVIGDVMYAVGGEAGPGGSPAVATLEAFDLSAGTWTTTLTSMPVAAKFLTAAAVDGILYAIGGDPATVYAYDPGTDAWTTKSVVPTNRSAMKAGVLDGLIYVVGGNAVGASNVVEVYNPKTNSWAAATSMPASRGQFGLGVLDGRLFAIGGLQSPSTVMTALHAFRPSEGTWWSSDSSVATISAFGFATGVAEGTASIIAKAVALECETSGSCGTLNVTDDGGGGGEESCATLTFTLASGSAVFGQVGVSVIDPATGEVVFTFDAAIGVALEVPDQPFRLQFTAPAGFTVTPSTYDLDALCGQTLTLELNFTPIAPPTPAELIATLMAEAAVADIGQAANLLRSALGRIETGNVEAACNQLGAFINQVRAQTGKNLTAAEAAGLIDSATAVRSALGCP